MTPDAIMTAARAGHLADVVTRVIVDTGGLGVTPQRAANEYQIRPDVVFIRKDGWTLGAPYHLRTLARSIWSGEWIDEIDVTATLRREVEAANQ